MNQKKSSRALQERSTRSPENGCLNWRIVLEYIESDAFITFPESLFHCLTESHAELPNVICRAASESLTTQRGGKMRMAGYVVHLIATLVVRQYEQAKDAELKRDASTSLTD